MTTVQYICELIEEVAPLTLQEGYDNAGLQVGDLQMEVRGVLLCIDVTEAVLDEAVRKGCNLVVSHHPLIFGGLKRLTGANEVQRCVVKAVKHDIAVYSAHTNMDNVLQGVNGKIAEKLGLTQVHILQPKPGDDSRQTGAGLVGELPEPMDEADFLLGVKERFGLEVVRHTRFLGKPVKRVAVCGGAGSAFLHDALRAQADVFISGDFKYHEFFSADGKILIADIGHYESEQYTKEIFYEIIRKKIPNFAIRISDIKTNPINYL